MTTKNSEKAKDSIDLLTGEAESLGLTDYPDSVWFRSLRQKALRWFEKEKRDLPWRKVHTPYRVWISEIMLQQTQVQTVIEYFNRFVKSFPTVERLAAAPEAEVLAHWEGLGYYRRARNLHAAAKEICERHGGNFPTQFDEVLSLPGIGRYTAGAILSISLDQNHPILEGNTYRLYSRLLAMTANPRDRIPEKHLWKFATDLLPGNRSRQKPGQLNQSLMEIGSKVCKPKNPNCAECPLQSLCSAHQLGLQESIPKLGKKIVYEELRQALLFIRVAPKKWLVRKSGPGEWWSGLWDFLRLDLTDSPSQHSSSPTEITSKQVAEQLQKHFGIQAEIKVQPFASIKHGVTKYRITLDCYEVEWQKPSNHSNWGSEPGIVAKSQKQIEELPLNITARKAFARLMESGS